MNGSAYINEIAENLIPQIDSHCMGVDDARDLLIYCGFGCDCLSPSGFMDWLKQKMREDRRLEGAFLAARATIVVTSSHGGKQSGCNPEN